MISGNNSGRPYVDVEKIREFLREDCTWIQHAAIQTIFKNAFDFGTKSIPVGEDLMDVALNSRDPDVRQDCQILVQRYVRNHVGTPKIMERLREEAERPEGEHDRFLMETAIIAIASGHLKDSADILASVIHRDVRPPEMREVVYRMLKYSLGKGTELDMVWGEIARAIVQKEKHSEISQIRNLQDLMRPPIPSRKKALPIQQGNPRKLARIGSV